MLVYVTPLVPQSGSNCDVAWQASSQADLVVPIPGTATVEVLLWVVDDIELKLLSAALPHWKPDITNWSSDFTYTQKATFFINLQLGIIFYMALYMYIKIWTRINVFFILLWYIFLKIVLFYKIWIWLNFSNLVFIKHVF